MNDREDAPTGSRRAYLIGFVLSLSLTLSAWLLIRKHVQSHHLFWTDKALVIAVIVLAIVQLVVQLVFFLHLFSERKPRWNLTVAGFALMVLLILVLGSLWIMYSLDYHHPHKALSPSELNRSIIKDEGIKP